MISNYWPTKIYYKKINIILSELVKKFRMLFYTIIYKLQKNY